MARNLATIRAHVMARLGDDTSLIWTATEVEGYLRDGYAALATALPLFWDQIYLENLPAAFSYTEDWEAVYAVFNSGEANYTSDFEVDYFTDPRDAIGPASTTSPFESTDGHSSAAIPGLSELPRTLTQLDRATWDGRGIDALSARALRSGDTMYRLTEGEVYGYLWEAEGVRSFRKVRVPSAIADSATVNGSWGALRRPTDLSTDTVSGTWGFPRRIPGMHPIGTESFGIARRPYLEGTNVRVEHFRHGRAMDTGIDVCELPDRYALFLEDYAQAQCLNRAGPGQDLRLAGLFLTRWTRAVARLQRRAARVTSARVGVLGGSPPTRRGPPPRPSYPWPYGAQVR